MTSEKASAMSPKCEKKLNIDLQRVFSGNCQCVSCFVIIKTAETSEISNLTVIIYIKNINCNILFCNQNWQTQLLTLAELSCEWFPSWQLSIFQAMHLLLISNLCFLVFLLFSLSAKHNGLIMSAKRITFFMPNGNKKNKKKTNTNTKTHILNF